MSALDRSQAARRITLVGALVNALLSIGKILGGIYGRSHALFADGVHSLADLMIDFLVIFASHFGSQHPDEEHPYGHRRIETAATVFLSVVLILTGFGIAQDAFNNLLHADTDVPSRFVLLIAACSILAKEGLFQYTRLVAKKIQSELLFASAWHHRSDAASSVVVLIGVAASQLGFRYFDAAAAGVVGLMIIKMGADLAWSSLQELVDRGVDDEVLQQIRNVIHSVPGVVGVHQLRTRSMGGKILIDVHALVSPHISVSEGHHIGQQIHHQLEQQVKDVTDVTVHIDPEDDEQHMPSVRLPARGEVMSLVQQRWQSLPLFASIERVTLHYLNGSMTLELHFPIVQLADQNPQQLAQQYRSAVADLVFIRSVELLFK